jgi:hypothetical protein
VKPARTSIHREEGEEAKESEKFSDCFTYCMGNGKWEDAFSTILGVWWVLFWRLRKGALLHLGSKGTKYPGVDSK